MLITTPGPEALAADNFIPAALYKVHFYFSLGKRGPAGSKHMLQPGDFIVNGFPALSSISMLLGRNAPSREMLKKTLTKKANYS